jgi:hypothetical protein
VDQAVAITCTASDNLSGSIDDVTPGAIEAMETFGAPTRPPEYHVYAGTPACGTIAIWTPVPGN